MNREERRSLEKQGASKETVEKLGALSSPCTLAEAVQISRASAEDVVADYHRNQMNIYFSMSLQVEILKEVLFSSGMITEEEFKARYFKKAKELQEMQKQQMNPEVTAAMKVDAGDVEIRTEK